MKRRRVLQSLLAVPAATALPAQQPVVPPPARQVAETPKLATFNPDGMAPPLPGYFSKDQFEALGRLASLIMPANGDLPGAREAGAAEFLDFLISKSPAERQKLYRDGLDRLNADARKAGGKSFAAITDEQAVQILAPLKKPWTYADPVDPFERFLRAAKEDTIRATFNSREYVAAASARSRSAGGTGSYWYPIDPIE